MERLEDKYRGRPWFDGLSLKQQLFVVAYTVGPTRGNGAASYRAAGYATRRGRGQSHKLLARDDVQLAIRKIKQHEPLRAGDGQVGPAEMLLILADIIRSPDLAVRPRLAAMRLNAELQRMYDRKIEDEEIVIDLVGVDENTKTVNLKEYKRQHGNG